MIGQLPLKQDGSIDYEKLTPSEYQPSEEVKRLTQMIRDDYTIGWDILNRPFTEFNNKSMIERMNIDQKAFNSYVQPKSTDPTIAWRWNGIRPITRNKLLAIAAHVIALMLYPEVVAQNDMDELDKKAAQIMKYLMEWLIRNSDYEISFLYAVIAALVNPVAYLEAEYVEAVQKIRKRNEKGEITFEEMIDETISGFQVHNIPADEILIANPYEYYLQRQRFIIRRKFVEYDEAKAIYGDHPNFQYVQPGVRCFLEDSSGMFYEQKDDQLGSLCEVVIYKNRREDLEVHYVNGIYMGDEDVENNPIRHRDYRGAPKYNLVKFGYHPIDEKRFYFYKSAAFELSNDQELVDKIWRLFIDGSWLETMPPTAVIGGKKLGSNIMFPGAVTNLPREADIKSLNPQRNLNAAVNALALTEKSMEETSVSRTLEGEVAGEKRTAFEIARAERNARIQLGIFGKMVAAMVKEFGELMVDIIINHLTIAHIQETTGGAVQMTYRTFLLPNQSENGRTITRKIRFEGELIGKIMSEKERERESFKVLAEEGGPEGELRLYRVNPALFRRLKFLIYVETGNLLPKNEAFEQILKLEKYDRLIQNPFINQEQVTRDFLVEPLTGGEVDKYMRKGDFIQNQILNLPEIKKRAVSPETGEPSSPRSLAGMLEREAL